MSTAVAKRQAKRAARAVYGTLERVAVLSTGEERLGILASHPIDRALMKERGYKEGDELRLEIKHARNAKFHRLLHAVGQVMVDNVDGWEHLNAHDAVKRLQLESDTCCETVEMGASSVIQALLAACESVLGQGAAKMLAAVLPEIKTIPVRVAESLAFDEMTPERFDQLFKGVTKHIDDNYSPDFTSDAKAEYLQMVERDRQ